MIYFKIDGQMPGYKSVLIGDTVFIDGEAIGHSGQTPRASLQNWRRYRKVKEDPGLQSWRYQKGLRKRIEEVESIFKEKKNGVITFSNYFVCLFVLWHLNLVCS